MRHAQCLLFALMAQIKGSKLSSKLVFLRQQFGESGVERVLAAMSDADRAALKSVIDLKWYPFDLYDRLLGSIVATVGGGKESILDRLGESSADHQLSNIYAAYKRDELVKMFKNMIPMHSHMNDPGQMEVVTTGPAACTIVVAAPTSTPTACRVSRAFYKRVAEISGATDVRVEETTCTGRGDAACRFEIHAE